MRRDVKGPPGLKVEMMRAFLDPGFIRSRILMARVVAQSPHRSWGAHPHAEISK